MYESRPEGFDDDRKNNAVRPSTKELTDAKKIEYLKQENEFIKKIFRWIERQTGSASESIHQMQIHQRNN